MKTPLSCTLLVALAGAACGGDALTSDDADPGSYTCPGGCVYVTRDNPVLTNDSLLLQSEAEGVFEEAERTEEGWSYREFEFKIAQSGHNLAFGTDTETTLAVWPSKIGTVAPAEGQTAVLNWSIPGARIGYSDLTFRVTKNRTVRKPPPGQTEINREAEDTKVALRPDIILVPIQVAQFVGDYAGAPDPRTTDKLNELHSRLLFDEAWVPRINRFPIEGFLGVLAGSWTSRNVHNYFSWAENYTPDSIFEQCGIQFRMVKHIEVPASQDWWEMVDGNTPACSLFAEARLRTMRAASVDAGLRADLPIILHTRTLMNPKCDNYDMVQELACSGGSCGGANWTVIDAYKVVDFNPYVISHELGHVLGLPDLQKSSAICSNGNQHLMCQSTARQSGNLQGGPSGASCEVARGNAATYARRYFDTTGTDFTGGDY